MVNENEVKEIKIEKSFKVEKSLIYLIVAVLCFFLILIVILFFGFVYLTKPEVLLSPPTISSFLVGINDSYRVVIGDRVSVEERNLINDFVLGFGDLGILRESEYSQGKNFIIIGIGDSFEDTSYLEHLGDNDSIVIYSSERDSLYIYSRDLDSLKEVLEILMGDSEGLEYSSIMVNNGVVEELMI